MTTRQQADALYKLGDQIINDQWEENEMDQVQNLYAAVSQMVDLKSK